MELCRPVAILSAPKIREQHFSELAQGGGGSGIKYLSLITFTSAKSVAMGTPCRGEGTLDLTVSGSWFRHSCLG